MESQTQNSGKDTSTLTRLQIIVSSWTHPVSSALSWVIPFPPLVLSFPFLNNDQTTGFPRFFPIQTLQKEEKEVAYSGKNKRKHKGCIKSCIYTHEPTCLYFCHWYRSSLTGGGGKRTFSVKTQVFASRKNSTFQKTSVAGVDMVANQSLILPWPMDPPPNSTSQI